MPTTRQSRAHSNWLARSSTLRSAASDQDQPHTFHVANSRAVAAAEAELARDLRVAASRDKVSEAALAVLQEEEDAAALLHPVLREAGGEVRWLRTSTNN